MAAWAIVVARAAVRGSRDVGRPAPDTGLVKAPGEDRSAQPVHRHATPPAERTGESARPGRPLTATAVQRLQRIAGNRAAARLAGSRAAQPAPVQRLASAPAEAPARGGAESDPKFAALKSEVAGKQKVMKAHPAPAGEASAAQGAAKPPQDDKEAQGKAANAEKMNAAKPGEFNKAAFIKAVNDAIAAQAPKNLDEADKFGDSGKAAAVKGQVQGQVSAGKKTSAGPIETTTNAPPDTAAAKEKPVTPLRPDQPPPAPAPPDPSKAVPDKAPASATDFSDGPKQVDAQMADAQVTEDQLAHSNEPEFTGALKDKKEGEQHAATAPGQVRAAESATLAGARGQAAQAGSSAMTALATDRKQAGAAVAAGKEGAKGKDETQRAQVTAKLQKVFDATKKDVEDILSGLDKKVDEKFTAGEKAVRDAFTAEHKRKMDAYKDARYSGWTGKLRWVKDKFTGLPEEANQIFVQARQGYVNGMQKVISDVADIIGAELTRAKTRIATGRSELQAAVASLSPELQAIGKQAAGEFAGKFDELTESVDAKGKELVNTLATKYNEALKSVDEEIAAEKEKNKGLVAKAMDAVKGVIDTILKLKDLLLGVLAKAASAVAAIIKDPIGFLGKLVSAVGAGLRAFLANIGEHLKKGLVGWLMGAMAGAGLQLPAKFDLRGIIMMIGSLLGLTWSAIRGRIVQRGVPEQAIGAVESSVPVVQKLQSEGIGGIWETIKEKVGDLKANLFSKISEYLIPTVLIAGITWIISLLNPASAFVKACKMIIDIVTFIIERGAQIIAFVNSVLDAIIAIAAGGTGGVPTLIETALATSIPVLIGALAAILGISGIADKIKKFLQSLSKPIMKAVDWIVDKIVKLGKKIWAKIKSKLGGADKRTTEQKEHDVRRAGADAERLLNESHATPASINAGLPAIKRKYKLTGISLGRVGEKHAITVTINPQWTTPAVALTAGSPEEQKVRDKLTKLGIGGHDADRIVDILTNDSTGGEISQHIIAGTFESAKGYGQLVRQIAQVGMVRGVRQSLAEATDLKSHGVAIANMEFEPAKASWPKGADVDLAVIQPDGKSTIYQFISKSVALPRAFSGHLRTKAQQLVGVPATERILVAEYPQATMADYLVRKANLDKSLSALRASFSGIVIRIELQDGNL
jgi:hypothetical protein